MTARDAAPGFPFDSTALHDRIARQWDDDIVPQLVDYIRLPAKSPNFDPDWKRHGQLEASVALAHAWAARQGNDTVVFYGHLDKQPEMTGWRPGMGPWTPVIEQGRLYGRGGADDGYAVFAALSAIAALD